MKKKRTESLSHSTPILHHIIIVSKVLITRDILPIMASRRESIFSNIISSLSSCCATSCSQALDYDLQFTMLNWNKRQSSLLSITLHQQSFFFCSYTLMKRRVVTVTFTRTIRDSILYEKCSHLATEWCSTSLPLQSHTFSFRGRFSLFLYDEYIFFSLIDCIVEFEL